MSISLVIRLTMFTLLFVGLIVGVFTQQFILFLPYLCLSPFVGIWLGRATVGAFKEIGYTRINDREREVLSRYRQSGSQRG